MRPSGRKTDQMRKVSFERNFSKHAEGSCLVKFGDTHVLCTASLEERVPNWMRNTGRGWVTAEYGMLPRSKDTARISSNWRLDGRIASPVLGFGFVAAFRPMRGLAQRKTPLQ